MNERKKSKKFLSKHFYTNSFSNRFLIVFDSFGFFLLIIEKICHFFSLPVNVSTHLYKKNQQGLGEDNATIRRIIKVTWAIKYRKFGDC